MEGAFNMNGKEFKEQFLPKEYEIDNHKIDQLESLSFKIKGWCVTLWLALISYLIKEKALSLPFFAIIIFFISLFGYFDFNFKFVQHVIIRRTRDIEEYLVDKWFKNRENAKFEYPFTSLKLRQALRGKAEWKKHLICTVISTPNYYLVYVSLIAATIIAFFLHFWRVL
jgi:hypothetical protein